MSINSSILFSTISTSFYKKTPNNCFSWEEGRFRTTKPESRFKTMTNETKTGNKLRRRLNVLTSEEKTATIELKFLSNSWNLKILKRRGCVSSRRNVPRVHSSESYSTLICSTLMSRSAGWSPDPEGAKLFPGIAKGQTGLGGRIGTGDFLIFLGSADFRCLGWKKSCRSSNK